MSILQSLALSQDALKMRWKEPYVTAGLNTKNITVHPKGVLAGFRVVPNAGFLVDLQLDPSLGLSVANVLETTGGYYSVSIIQNTTVTIDLTAQANTTVFVTLDVQYVVGANTTGQVKVVDAAELVSNLDLIVLAKVNVPLVGPVLATHINMGYRMSAGETSPTEGFQPFNLINNGTFEANNILGWTASGFDTAAASTDTARTGTYSVKLTRAVAGSPTLTSGPMVVIPARKYKVGAWMRSTGGAPITSGNGAKLRVYWYDVLGVQIGSPDDVETAFTGGGIVFIQKRAELTAPALAVTAQLVVFYDACSGTLYVDDVQFLVFSIDALAQSPVFGGPSSAADSFHTHTALGLNYGGGVNWADGTTNPATTIEGQLDKILADLAGASGAPKVGNAPSKILANTFTQLNSFNLGIAVGGASHLTFGASNQRVQWPTWNVAEVSGLQWSLTGPGTTAAGFVSLFGSIGLSLTDGTNSLVVQQSGATGSVGTFTAGDLFFKTNDIQRWKVVGATGVLEAVGGNRKIANVLDPVAAQDAATKLYVDTRSSSINICHNGNMGIWARGTAAVSVTANVLGYSAKARRADRWYGMMRVDGAGGFGNNTFSFERQPYPANNQILNVARLTFTDKRIGASGFISLTQELDRDMVRLARGKKLTICFKWAKGAGFAGNGLIEVVSSTGDSWRNLANYNGTNAILGSEFVAAAAISNTITSGQKVFVTGSVVPLDANAVSFYISRDMTSGAGPTNFLDVSEVIVLIGDKTVSYTPPSEFPLAGVTYAGEVAICKRFYQSSSDLGDVGGVGFLHAGQNGAPTAFAQTTAIFGDRYLWRDLGTQMRASFNQGLATFKIWAPDGTANNVYDNFDLVNVGVNLAFSGAGEQELLFSVSTFADRGCTYQFELDADFSV